jgi:hypothetical protein
MIICRDKGRLPALLPAVPIDGRTLHILSRLWQFAGVTPVMTRKKLVQSLVISHFLYCDVIYSRASVEA